MDLKGEFMSPGHLGPTISNAEAVVEGSVFVRCLPQFTCELVAAVPDRQFGP